MLTGPPPPRIIPGGWETDGIVAGGSGGMSDSPSEPSVLLHGRGAVGATNTVRALQDVEHYGTQGYWTAEYIATLSNINDQYKSSACSTTPLTSQHRTAGWRKPPQNHKLYPHNGTRKDSITSKGTQHGYHNLYPHKGTSKNSMATKGTHHGYYNLYPHKGTGKNSMTTKGTQHGYHKLYPKTGPGPPMGTITPVARGRSCERPVGRWHTHTDISPFTEQDKVQPQERTLEKRVWYNGQSRGTWL